MKKLLLTISLLGLTLTSALAQGTIAFGNSALTRVICVSSEGIRHATAADGFTFGVFYGPAGTTDLILAPGTARIGAVDGIMTGAASVLPLPGTEPGQIVSLQIRAWNDLGLIGESKIAQITLGPTAGPGAVIWQTDSGNNPSRFTPLVVCPEPSTWALGSLFSAFLLFRLRKTTKSN